MFFQGGLASSPTVQRSYGNPFKTGYVRTLRQLRSLYINDEREFLWAQELDWDQLCSI